MTDTTPTPAQADEKAREAETVIMVAAIIDPEIWADNLPVPTRGAVEDFHNRRRSSCDTARRILAAIRPESEAVAYEHSMREPDGQTHTMFSRSQDNPWSHWLQKHRDTCVYSCRPLFASPPAPAVKVKALVWNEPTKLTNGCWTADCIFGTYSVAFDDGWYACLEDGSRWEWQPENDPRSYEGPHAAQAACQAHLEARIRSSLLPPSTEAHPDDLAVDRFAAAMKTKLAKKRAEGRGGWEDKDDCSNAFLSQLLREHTDKGDPVDVGNLAMMIHQRGERIG